LTISDLCLTEIKALARTGLINFVDGNNEITSKPECEIMAKYSISFVTMKKYMQVCSMCSQYYMYRDTTESFIKIVLPRTIVLKNGFTKDIKYM